MDVTFQRSNCPTIQGLETHRTNLLIDLENMLVEVGALPEDDLRLKQSQRLRAEEQENKAIVNGEDEDDWD